MPTIACQRLTLTMLLLAAARVESPAWRPVFLVVVAEAVRPPAAWWIFSDSVSRLVAAYWEASMFFECKGPIQ
jgi:hypothetical protein